MDMRWMAALALGSALALGACSSSPPQTGTGAGAGDQGGGDAGGGADPGAEPEPEPDARTAPQRTFDTAVAALIGVDEADVATRSWVDFELAAGAAGGSVGRAMAAVAEAKAAADGATAANRQDRIDALNNARTALLAELRKLDALATADVGDARAGIKVIVVAAAGRVEDGDTYAVAADVRTLQTLGQWSARQAGWPRYDLTAPESSALPSTRLTVQRRVRNTASVAVGALGPAQAAANDADHDNLLDGDSFDAVMYSGTNTKYVLAEGLSEGTGTTWLRMRGLDVGQKTHDTGVEQSSSGNRASDGQTIGYQLDNDTLIAGMQITANGLGVQLGGKWTGGLEFQRSLAQEIYASGGTPVQTIDNEGWDLTLAFGLPGASPDGNGDFYWTAPLHIDETQRSQAKHPDNGDTSVFAGRLGDYRIWLTNFVLTDTLANTYNTEPAARGVITTAGPADGDDDPDYLKFAAYGAMTFEPAQGFIRAGQYGRIHVFNIGYDAFADEADKRTTDLAASERITTTSGKFLGTTTGFTTPTDIAADPINRWYVDVSSARRIRGDIELTANIGQGAQAISGGIKNIQYWDATLNRGLGKWMPYGLLAGGTNGNQVDLGSATIDAKGAFKAAAGAVTDAAATDQFGAGRWQGAFYGPTDALEVAGTWYLTTDEDAAGVGTPPVSPEAGLVGSFGAKYVPNPEDP